MFLMQLKIRSLTQKLPVTVLETIERQFQYALSRIEGRIGSVQLTIRDNNGPRGGVDQECRVLVQMKDGTRITVSDTQDQLLAAVAKVAERAERVLSRRIERRRSMKQ